MPRQEFFIIKILPGVLLCEFEADQWVIDKYRKAIEGIFQRRENFFLCTLYLWS